MRKLILTLILLLVISNSVKAEIITVYTKNKHSPIREYTIDTKEIVSIEHSSYKKGWNYSSDWSYIDISFKNRKRVFLHYSDLEKDNWQREQYKRTRELLKQIGEK